MLTLASIEGLIKVGVFTFGAIQKLREAHAAGKVTITDGPNGPMMTPEELVSHFTRWEAAADAASQHASDRIENRHRNDEEPPL